MNLDWILSVIRLISLVEENSNLFLFCSTVERRGTNEILVLRLYSFSSFRIVTRVLNRVFFFFFFFFPFAFPSFRLISRVSLFSTWSAYDEQKRISFEIIILILIIGEKQKKRQKERRKLTFFIKKKLDICSRHNESHFLFKTLINEWVYLHAIIVNTKSIINKYKFTYGFIRFLVTIEKFSDDFNGENVI